MKLQKLVDKRKGIDTYVIRIKHDEATLAFKAMTTEERELIHDLQQLEQMSSVLKALTLWVERIEDTQGPLVRTEKSGGEARYEG